MEGGFAIGLLFFPAQAANELPFPDSTDGTRTFSVARNAAVSISNSSSVSEAVHGLIDPVRMPLHDFLASVAQMRSRINAHTDASS